MTSKMIKKSIRRAPVPPSEMLRDALDRAGISANAAAGKMRIPANRLTAILNGQRGITPETALRLARFFGTSAEMWINMQVQYDLEEAQQKFAAQINREVETLAQIA
jgi:antitoxin HigA-1